MSGVQLEFDLGCQLGIKPARPKRFSGSRLFLAVQPPRPVAETIQAIGRDVSRRHRLTGRLRPLEILHVSLVGFEPRRRIPGELVAGLKKIISGVPFDNFEVVFDRVMSFRNHRRNPLVLYGNGDNERLVVLQKAIERELEPFLRKPVSSQPFRPHLTVLYDRAEIEPEPIGTAIRWTVEEVRLIESLQGRTTYNHLHSFPSSGAPSPSQ